MSVASEILGIYFGKKLQSLQPSYTSQSLEKPSDICPNAVQETEHMNNWINVYYSIDVTVRN